jgi:hypothetical protein
MVEGHININFILKNPKIKYLAAMLKKKITSKITTEKGKTLALSVKLTNTKKGPLTDFLRYPSKLTKHH